MNSSGKPDFAKSNQTQTDFGGLQKCWLEMAQMFDRYDATSHATVLRECAKDLEHVMKSAADRSLSLTEASHLSGYSTDHLGRLVREGRIPNVGRKGKPLLREGDLPRRVSKVDTSPKAKYDPATDARNLRSRGRRIA